MLLPAEVVAVLPVPACTTLFPLIETATLGPWGPGFGGGAAQAVGALTPSARSGAPAHAAMNPADFFIETIPTAQQGCRPFDGSENCC
jgi:hypothetical protein